MQRPGDFTCYRQIQKDEFSPRKMGIPSSWISSQILKSGPLEQAQGNKKQWERETFSPVCSVTALQGLTEQFIKCNTTRLFSLRQ